MLRQYSLEIALGIVFILVLAWYCHYTFYVPYRLQRQITMPLTVELGTLTPDEKKNFDILITNSGSKPVRIETIEMSCGCLSVDNPRPVLAAKTTTPVPFSFAAPSSPGHSEKMVLFKPAKSPDVAWFVDVTADVYAERWASPGKIEFLYSDEPSKTQQSKTIRITSAKPALIDSISCDVPDIHCEWGTQKETENDVRITFNQSDETDITHNVQGKILVKYKDDTVFSIPLTISPVPCCRLIQGSMRLVYTKKQQEPVLRRMAVLSNHRIPSNELSVKVLQSWLTIKDISHNGGYAFITLEYSIAALPENWRGELLEISTQRPFEKVVCRGSVYESD